jgi:hypothetical protein
VGDHALLDAVEGVLNGCDLTLRADQRALMAETLRLQARLAHADADLEASRVAVAGLSADFAKVPDEFRCPVTCEVMADPVMCADGFTYERAAIERWLGSHVTSPKTNAPLPSRAVIPNHNLKGVIEAWKARRGV